MVFFNYISKKIITYKLQAICLGKRVGYKESYHGYTKNFIRIKVSILIVKLGYFIG